MDDSVTAFDPDSGPIFIGELLYEAYIDKAGLVKVKLNSQGDPFSHLTKYTPLSEVPYHYYTSFGAFFEIQVQSQELGDQLMAGWAGTLTQTAWLKVDGQIYQ